MAEFMLRLITDFDGPIMDISDRYYRVYLFCLREICPLHQTMQPLTKTEFWRLKRARRPESEIGQRSGLTSEQAEDFAQLRKRTVHTLPYLVYDTPIPGAIDTLDSLQQAGVELVTMTMRRTQELNIALNQWDLGQFFALDRRYCLSDDHVKTNDVDDKTWLMGQALAEMPPAGITWMVGDTEADILAAKAHQIPVIAVLSGIRDQSQLVQHHPDAIVDNLAAAVALIRQQVPQPPAPSPSPS